MFFLMIRRVHKHIVTADIGYYPLFSQSANNETLNCSPWFYSVSEIIKCSHLSEKVLFGITVYQGRFRRYIAGIRLLLTSVECDFSVRAVYVVQKS